MRTPLFYALLILGIFNLYFTLEIIPQSNDECLWIQKRIDKDNVGVFFELVKKDGVTWEAGIRDGDRLLAINGVEIKNTGSAQYLLNQIAAGDSAYYHYERDGVEYEEYVEIKKLINFGSLSYILTSLIWLIVGFIAIQSNPEGKLQSLFYKVGIIFTFFASSSLLSDNFNSNPLYEYGWLITFISIVVIFAASFLPFYITSFFWMFPKPLPILNKNFIEKCLYWFPRIIFSVIITLFVLNIFGIFGSYLFHIRRYVDLFLSNLFIISVAVGLVSLIYSYTKLKEKKERRPVFVIVISYSLAVLAIIYTSTLANELAESIFNNPEFFLPILFVAVLPLSFGYSIFKYSLMEVSDVIKNAIFYGFLTISLAASYFLVIYILGLGISSAISTEYQGIIAGIIFVIFALLFQSTKDKFQEYITRKFYPEQFAAQKILIQFSREIPMVVGMENILNYTQEIFIDSLKVRKYAFYLCSNDNEKFSLVRSYGVYALPVEFNCGNPLLMESIGLKENLNNNHIIEQEEFKLLFPSIADELTKELIYTAVPLIVKSRIIGLMLFGLKYSGARFAGKDLELLSAASNQVSVALENARLYESEVEKMKLEHDLENARKIQESLLPKVIPDMESLQIAGCMIPAMHVGGDYYDFIKVSDNKLFVIIGDVSGKGLAASFYMSKLQTMMRLYCDENTSPKEVLAKINKTMFESIERNSFITVAVGLFDIKKKKLYYCRAGHTPLIEMNVNEIFYHQSKGIGVGLEKGEIFDSSLDEIEIDLTKQHSYVFFSDGITEAMNETNELFGNTRFEKLLIENSHKTSNEILYSTIDTLEKFRTKTPQNDDITLVVVRYN